MSEEAVAGRKYLLNGSTRVDIVEPGRMPVEWVDSLTECRLVDNVVLIGLGAFVLDANGPPEIQVVTRLRLPLVLMGQIQNVIEQLQKDAAAAKQSAN